MIKKIRKKEKECKFDLLSNIINILTKLIIFVDKKIIFITVSQSLYYQK